MVRGGLSLKEAILEMKSITKAFPGVIALDSVNFSVFPGEIHALVGKNGAGKSTLISIISGVYGPDKGELFVDGTKIPYSHLHNLPVSTVYQESTVFPNLSIADNVFAGDEPINSLAMVSNQTKIEETKKLLEIFQLNFNPLTLVTQLSPAEKKLVEILRALQKKSRIMILDEPTAALTLAETKKLFQLLHNLKKSEIGIIYISHRLEEIFEVADRVTVLRDGVWQGTEYINQIDMQRLITMMVGKKKELIEEVKKDEVEVKDKGGVLCEVKNLTHYYRKFKDISFQIRKNEILGLAGLIGAGKTELAKAIFGQERLETGEIELEGKKISINSPLDAIHNGIVYITENRKEEGLFLDTSIKNNIVAPDLASVANHMGFISDQKINQISTQVIQQFNIKAYDADQITNTLSGGNQQKVLLGLWLHLKPKVLLVDEPTVGIDVESKTEIYKLLRKIADSGVAVIMISSEIKELLNNSDRIITMYKGTIIEEFIASQVSEKELLASISGISNRE